MLTLLWFLTELLGRFDQPVWPRPLKSFQLCLGKPAEEERGIVLVEKWGLVWLTEVIVLQSILEGQAAVETVAFWPSRHRGRMNRCTRIFLITVTCL